MGFAGFSEAAFDFYDDLEVDNTKAFWNAHREIYDSQVKAPIKALCDELAPEFGTAKIFRPNRDVRFSKDKSPYKTSQGAFVDLTPTMGWYVQVSAAGAMTGGGFYAAAPAELARFRTAIDGPAGATLEKIVASLTAQGWQIGGDQLVTAPRGYPTDHPRIELLRHKALVFSKEYGTAPVVHTPAFLEVVRTDWDELRPLVQWLEPVLETNASESGSRH